jgi:hypothetical protein
MEPDLNCRQLHVRTKCYENRRGDTRIGVGGLGGFVGQGDVRGHANFVLNSQAVMVLSCSILVVY